ncbi:MAG: Fic family protein, partial [Geminicoccaceae bacterium]
MKLPESPRPLVDFFRERRDRFSEIVQRNPRPEVDGKYLHWDDLRHRTPPASLRAIEWWVGIKLSRSLAASQLPLRDASGQAF